MDGYTTTAVTISKEEFDFLVKQAEKADAQPPTRTFGENVKRKIITELASIKSWTLFTILWMPFYLVKAHLISGDNFTTILTITAPLVIGVREFGKIIKGRDDSPQSSSSGLLSSLWTTVKGKLFK